MTFTKLFKFCYGIMIAEGWNAMDEGNQGPTPTASYARHNPGNLRLSEFQVANDNNFSIFANDLEGMFALIYQIVQIALGRVQAYGDNDTISKALATYTGLPEGSPEHTNYVATVCNVAGCKATDLISTIL